MKKNTLKRSFLITLGAFFLVSPAGAQDGKPFIKTFSPDSKELRVYYQDWLVVCEDSGAGKCRAVGSSVDTQGRLSIEDSLKTGQRSLIYSHPLAQKELDSLSIGVDYKLRRKLESEEYQPKVANKFGNIVLETYEITRPDLVESYITDFRKGLSVKFEFFDKDNYGIESVFSLRGITKALNFIDNQEEKQKREKN